MQIRVSCEHVLRTTFLFLSAVLISAPEQADSAPLWTDDQVVLESALACKTHRVTPDGDRFLFYKTRKGNLTQTVLVGATAGQSVLYEPATKPNTYTSGVVTVSIGQEFVIDFGGESFFGTCSPMTARPEVGASQAGRLNTAAAGKHTDPASVDVVLPKSRAEEIMGIRPAVFIHGQLGVDTLRQVRALISLHKLDERGTTVYFNSLGGNLFSGIELGKLMREAGLHTSVGTRQPDDKGMMWTGPGVCLSACVYAYVGGQYRYADKDDVIGVHRFSREVTTPKDLELAQIVSAAITNHLSAMGVDTELLEIASATAKDDITRISIVDATRLRVVNNGRHPATWELVNREGMVYLRAEQTTHWGMGKLLLNCRKARVNVTAIYDMGSGIDHLTSNGRYSIRIDNDMVDVQLDGPVKVLNTSYVNAGFWLSPEIAQRLLRADKIGFAFHALNPDLFFGFQIDAQEGRAKIDDYLKFCRTQV
jgi:hypothetical protein